MKILCACEESQAVCIQLSNLGQVGDTVFVIGKYVPDPLEKPRIIEAQISHIKHRQYVAYGIDENNFGEWCFSRKHIGKSVFYSREEAEKALREREQDA